MPKSVITEGKTSTEAIEKGLKELNVSKNQVEIKILEEKKKSFFSILDPHVVKVELTLKENGLSVVDEICDISTRVIVNKSSFKLKKKEINNFIDKIRSVSSK